MSRSTLTPVTANAPATAVVTNGETELTKDSDAVEATRGSHLVAPGRTIDGKGPGETVELDDGDARRLLDLGFILGPDGTRVLPDVEGPKVVSGSEIKER